MRAALAALLLCACHVYDEQCAPRNNPGGGVTVRASELEDDAGGDDAGTGEGVEVEARKL